MNSFLKRIPVTILIIAMSLSLSACNSNNSESSSSTSSIEASDTTLKGEDPNASGINVDTGDVKVRIGENEIATDVGDDVKVRIGENGIYTKVGDDIMVETSGDRVKVKVGGLSVNVSSNEAGIVSSMLSKLSSMFSDDNDE